MLVPFARSTNLWKSNLTLVLIFLFSFPYVVIRDGLFLRKNENSEEKYYF